MKLKTVKGKETDILHSKKFYKASAQQRQDMAFDDKFLKTLNTTDKLLMRGYAEAKQREIDAFKYNNPEYEATKYTAKVKKASKK